MRKWVEYGVGFALAAIIITGMLLLQGCAPPPMSLTAAIQQAQASLAAVRKAPSAGAEMYACKATITYQVGASGGLATRLGMLPPTLTVGGTTGSTMAVEFDSPLCVKNKPSPGEVPIMAPLPEGPFP